MVHVAKGCWNGIMFAEIEDSRHTTRNKQMWSKCGANGVEDTQMDNSVK